MPKSLPMLAKNFLVKAIYICQPKNAFYNVQLLVKKINNCFVVPIKLLYHRGTKEDLISKVLLKKEDQGCITLTFY